MAATIESQFHSSKKSLTCAHCKKTGHSKSQCYRLVGFPSTFKFTKTRKEEPKSSTQNVITTTSGSITQEQFQQLMQMLNNHSMQPNTSQVNSSICEKSMNPDGNSFSFESFVANVYKSSSKLQLYHSWIIDTGATDHMCSNKDFFSFLTPISQSHSIGMPNGHHTSVSFIGDVKLHDSLILHGVLYVPDFKYNLISVSKLSSHLQTFTLFTDEACLLQDPSQKHNLALGVIDKRINDLYVLDPYDFSSTLSYNVFVFKSYNDSHAFVTNSTLTSNTILWHNRFGHIPIHKLKTLSLLPSNCDEHCLKSCVICSKAKQHKLPFPASISSTTNPLNLFMLMFGVRINIKLMINSNIL